MPKFSIETSRSVEAPVDVAWSVVSDAAGYHRVVDGLAHTEITAGQGHGMVRHCVDTKGREWDETCTLWDEGRTFRMTVDITSYPASLRAILGRLEGTWAVEPDGDGSRISMRFDGEAKLGPLGRLAVAAMGRESVLGSVMDGYEAEIAERLQNEPG